MLLLFLAALDLPRLLENFVQVFLPSYSQGFASLRAILFHVVTGDHKDFVLDTDPQWVGNTQPEDS